MCHITETGCVQYDVRVEAEERFNYLNISRVVHNEIDVALIQTSGNMDCTYLFT